VTASDNEIRRGQVNRIIVRSLSDMCLTPQEVMQFAVEVSLKGVKVGEIFSLLPCDLVRIHPELVYPVSASAAGGQSVEYASSRSQLMRFESKPVTREDARRAVEEILGKSQEIRATTLTEAVAEAQRIRETDLLLGINSLWEWFCALPMDEQAKIGNFEGKYAKMRLWTSARFLCRPR